MNKIFGFILALFLVGSAGASLAYADSYGGYGGVPCQPIYGGGENCNLKGNILINKTVQNPSSHLFVDGLSMNDPHFSSLQNVNFELTVANTGTANLPSVTVTDVFPSYLNFVSGAGNFDLKTRTLTFTVANLGAGQSKTFDIQAKVVAPDSLPNDRAVTCVVNQAFAKTSDNQESDDHSEFCIEKQLTTTKGGLPVQPAPKMTQTPGTGPEMLPLIGLIPTGAFGFLLRRKASK